MPRSISTGTIQSQRKVIDPFSSTIRWKRIVEYHFVLFMYLSNFSNYFPRTFAIPWDKVKSFCKCLFVFKIHVNTYRIGIFSTAKLWKVRLNFFFLTNVFCWEQSSLFKIILNIYIYAFYNRETRESPGGKRTLNPRPPRGPSWTHPAPSWTPFPAPSTTSPPRSPPSSTAWTSSPTGARNSAERTRLRAGRHQL